MKSISAALGAVCLLAFLPNCGKGVNFGSMVTGTAQFLNGTTGVSSSRSMVSARSVGLGLSSGNYRITPKKMTVTVTGISFSDSFQDAEDKKIDLSDCTATYDQSRASLLKLSDCQISVPAGTYKTVTLFYSNTYQALFDDPVGIYSDPTSSTGLVTSVPSGGAGFISVRDQNSSQDTNQVTTNLSHAITINKDNPPRIYVVFNPIHWMVTSINGSSASTPMMAGNPPILVAVSPFSKAGYYSTVGTIGAYPMSGSQAGFVVLYSDASTPALVSQVDGSSFCVSGDNIPAVSFNGNSLDWGQFGRLGLFSGTLAWAIPGTGSSDNTSITGYAGVATMNELSSVGSTGTLSYQCTSTPPEAVDGVNYSSGLPALTADGSYTITLLSSY